MVNAIGIWVHPTREPLGPSLRSLIPLLTRKYSSPARRTRNRKRARTYDRRREELRAIMQGAFEDDEVDEKVALGSSSLADIYRGDVLIGQGGTYLHPRLR